MDKSIIFLNPDDIGVHPLIQFLEENGAFKYSQRELDIMVQSVQDIDFLQPILVTRLQRGVIRNI
jgi:hypothetical protein